MSNDTGKWLMVTGAGILLIGALIYFFHDKLGWLGRLPGDIRIENENTRFYFPIVTCLLVSGLVSLILYFVKRFF